MPWYKVVGLAFDGYSASVPAIIYAISYYIAPRFNGTRRYIVLSKKSISIVSALNDAAPKSDGYKAPIDNRHII